MRAAEHASRGPCRLLKRCHSFPEIIERGTGVRVEHVACFVAGQKIGFHYFRRSSPRRVVYRAGGTVLDS